MNRVLEIEPVSDRRDLEAFIRFPWQVYRHDRNWVPPLLSERRDRLNPEKNPFCSHASVQLFCARQEGRLVGTIAAFVDHQGNAYRGETIGGFGFFETVNDFEVAKALLDAASTKVREWGMTEIRGPTSFGPNDEPGILIDGADCPPAVLEGHTPPYYRELVERAGLTKFRDSYAWRVSLDKLRQEPDSLPAQVLKVFEAAAKRGEVRVRKARMDRWDEEVIIAHELFNTTLSHLADYVPTPVEVFRRLASQMKPLIDPDLALFAEMEGRTIGFLIAVPDPNRVLIHLNGRLFPIGWLKMLWHSRRIDVISFKLFGVLEEYRRRGIDVLLYLEAVRAAVAKGYRWLDGSLTSEFNPTVVRLAERLGAERYKHFRLYKLQLS